MTRGFAVYDATGKSQPHVEAAMLHTTLGAIRSFRADLHIHTCLSPCGGSAMIPPAIRDAAMAADIKLIAITDHNSSENVASVARACKEKITVLGGMEITSAEEIHLLAICPDDVSLSSLQSEIYEHLDGTNDPDRFGEQYVVDEEGFIIDTNRHLLSGATDLSADRLTDLIHDHNGLAIACHVDRMSFSIVSQLGFIPDSFEIDAVEISGLADASHSAPGAYHYPVISSSDAHEPDQIGASSTIFKVAGETVSSREARLPDFRDLQTALRNAGKSADNGAGKDGTITIVGTRS